MPREEILTGLRDSPVTKDLSGLSNTPLEKTTKNEEIKPIRLIIAFQEVLKKLSGDLPAVKIGSGQKGRHDAIH